MMINPTNPHHTKHADTNCLGWLALNSVKPCGRLIRFWLLLGAILIFVHNSAQAITYSSNPAVGTYKNVGAGYRVRVSAINGSNVSFEVMPKTVGGAFGSVGTALIRIGSKNGTTVGTGVQYNVGATTAGVIVVDMQAANVNLLAGNADFYVVRRDSAGLVDVNAWDGPITITSTNQAPTTSLTATMPGDGRLQVTVTANDDITNSLGSDLYISNTGNLATFNFASKKTTANLIRGVAATFYYSAAELAAVCSAGNSYRVRSNVFDGSGLEGIGYSGNFTYIPDQTQTGIYNQAFITDAEMLDYTSMSVAQIRSFLASKGSYFSATVNDYDGAPFDMAAVVYQAAQTSQISPKVILATLEKESQAVSKTTRPSDTRLRSLMGCGTATTGRDQIVCAASTFRSCFDRMTSTGSSISGWQVGVSKATQDGVNVTPANKAVACQFTYTPYAGKQWGGNTSYGGVYLFYYFWQQFGFSSGIPTPESPQMYVGYPCADFNPGSYAGRNFSPLGLGHLGEDISLPEGTPIYAIAPGTIRRYGAAQGYGTLVVAIEHDLGYDFVHTFTVGHTKTSTIRRYCSIYGHLRSDGLNWAVGDTVKRGDIIGYVQNAATNGDGNEHLHFGLFIHEYQGVVYGYYNAGVALATESHWVSGKEFIDALPRSSADDFDPDVPQATDAMLALNRTVPKIMSDITHPNALTSHYEARMMVRRILENLLNRGLTTTELGQISTATPFDDSSIRNDAVSRLEVHKMVISGLELVAGLGRPSIPPTLSVTDLPASGWERDATLGAIAWSIVDSDDLIDGKINVHTTVSRYRFAKWGAAMIDALLNPPIPSATAPMLALNATNPQVMNDLTDPRRYISHFEARAMVRRTVEVALGKTITDPIELAMISTATPFDDPTVHAGPVSRREAFKMLVGALEGIALRARPSSPGIPLQDMPTAGWQVDAITGANSWAIFDTADTPSAEIYESARVSRYAFAKWDNKVLTLLGTNTGDSFAQWVAQAGLTGADAAPDADPDADGLVNFLEFASGSIPTQASSVERPLLSMSSAGDLSFTFKRLSARTLLTYEVQTSDDLIHWTPEARSTAGGATQSLGGGVQSITDPGGSAPSITVRFLPPPNGKLFVRLDVSGG